MKRPLFRHLYDDKKRPIVTICTIQCYDPSEETTFFCRGIAICSPLDIKAGNFSKNRGRKIAIGRALKAFRVKKSWNRILDRGYENAKKTTLSGMFMDTIHLDKAAYSIKLAPYEADYFNVLVLKSRLSVGVL